MKSIFSILSAAVFFNGIAQPLLAADNYSLWPRRPAELEQARRLLREQKGAEAVHLLQPFIHDNGIAGREARQITGSINVQRYLSRRHPDARVYTVKPGDNVFKIAAAEKCPFELIMLLNGIVEPAGLRVGQKLVLVPMNCRAEINLAQQELCVWNDKTLVADYTLTTPPEKQISPTETAVTGREGYIQSALLPSHSLQMSAADRQITLENGWVISNSPGTGKLSMESKDINELALLLHVGCKVIIKER